MVPNSRFFFKTLQWTLSQRNHHCLFAPGSTTLFAFFHVNAAPFCIFSIYKFLAYYFLQILVKIKLTMNEKSVRTNFSDTGVPGIPAFKGSQNSDIFCRSSKNSSSCKIGLFGGVNSAFWQKFIKYIL